MQETKTRGAKRHERKMPAETGFSLSPLIARVFILFSDFH